MKATLFDKQGKKKSQIDLPKIFETKTRVDIVQKFYEADKLIQPYASDPEAGKRQSASGTISHKRHDWKGHYGRGISRIPRKTMSRRGTQFVWVGANIPGTKGGRRAHPPKGIGKEKKINKKEALLAFNSAFAATVNAKFIEERYATMDKVEYNGFVIESLPEKTKSLIEALKEIFKDKMNLIIKNKVVRPGKGKSRGRKYKSNAGVLIITSSEENATFKGFDVKSMAEVTIADLWPLGRLTIYTKQAIEELNSREQNSKAKVLQEKKK